MTTFHTRTGRFAAVLAVAATVALAGCGATASGSPAASAQAPTPATPAPATMTPAPAAPSPTAESTPSPTVAPTQAASGAPSGNPAALGGFAFLPGDILAYYAGLAFECKDAQPSTQAADYTIVRCLRTEKAGGPTEIVALVVSQDGVTGNAFAGYVNPAGGTFPDKKASFTFLASFLGAMLGTDVGAQAATWLAPNVGKELAQDTFGEILGGTYTENDANGVGYYVELANRAFMDAPAP
jgi:hypothetical protein